MRMALLEVRDLTVSFRTDRKAKAAAVRNVSFSVEKGTTLGIVGESGCGKSVTASAIMRLLPKTTGEITNGSILLDGCELTTLSEKEMRKIRGGRISMIFQDPITSLNPVQRVGTQMVEMLQVRQKISHGDAMRRAEELLRNVGVSDPARRLRCYPHELSGGMTQRVMIAMALSCSPSVLIADEPTTALDVTIQAQVLELIHLMQQQTQTAVLLITHDMGIVAENADFVMVMYAGEVVEYAPVSDIFTSPLHPYTQGLLKSLPRLDRDMDILYSIEGTVPAAYDELPGCRFAERCPQCREQCRMQPPPMRDLGQRRVRCHLQGGDANDV